MLKQDQYAYDEYTALATVVMGHKRLYEIMTEKDALYAKPDFSDADGMLAAELEHEFGELNGWDAEGEAAKLLSGMGVKEKLHGLKMKQLESSQKVRVLLAQALFGNPDILLLDEPTNHLDVETNLWLEEFLYEFKNTVIVISHDRHFIDKVCTHIADLDFGKIQLYAGNYSFWYESSQLVLRQRSDSNKKIEEKRKELQEFIARFSANASKSRQATSRKKLLEKLTLDDIKPSSRRYPHIYFKSEKEAGNDILDIEHMSIAADGRTMLNDFTLSVQKGERIAFLGRNDLVKTALFETIMGQLTPGSGTYKWGASALVAYYPKDNKKYFESGLNLIDWLRQYSGNKEEDFIRSFLGKMLFSGDETLKSVSVLSGGEKVRCMFARMMLTGANVLVMDEPTNHLDMESITSLNKGLENFTGTLLFSSQDHQFIQTLANRIIEITPDGFINRQMLLDEYLADEALKLSREALYALDNPH
jgi:ATPase subunit of ABC transporter with duplicated ATPase domains